MAVKGAELRPDGWWILFAEGEEAGPFAALHDAELFLDYVENLQRGLDIAKEKKDSSPDQIVGDNSAPGLNGL